MNICHYISLALHILRVYESFKCTAKLYQAQAGFGVWRLFEESQKLAEELS